MGLGVILVNKVGIVGTYQFYTIFVCQLNEHAVCLLLQRKGFAVSAHRGVGYLVALQLQIIVVAKHASVPFNGFAGTCNVVVQYLFGHFATNTGRAHN